MSSTLENTKKQATPSANLNARDLAIFNSVVKCYLQNLHNLTLSPLQAIDHSAYCRNPDEPLEPGQEPSRNRRKNPIDAICYCADVESITRKFALAGRPLEQLCLDAILKEEAGTAETNSAFSESVRLSTIQHCARAWRGHGCSPTQYFQKVKR